MTFEYRIILDFEAISSNFIKRLPKNKNIKTYDVVYCVSLSINDKMTNKSQNTKFIFSELKNKDIYEIENELFWKMINYILTITKTSSIDEITKKVEFYGWNPDLENQFFKRMSRKNHISLIYVKNLLPNSKLKFSLDKITNGTKYKRYFFTLIDNIVPDYYKKTKDRPGYLAAVLGYIIFCKNNSILITEKALGKIAKNTTNKQLWNQILPYSNADVTKTVYMFKQIKNFDIFTKDYLLFSQTLKKHIDKKAIPFKLQNKYLKNILELLSLINKYKKYDFQSIFKLTIDLNNPNFIDSIVNKINAGFYNSDKEFAKLKSLIETFQYNKNDDNCIFYNLEQITKVIEDNNKKIKEYEAERKNKNIMFVESFYKTYIASKPKEKWWLKLI